MKKSHIRCLVHLGKAFIIIRPCSLDNNTPNRPVLNAWETFNIRQKLGVFGLHS